MKNYRTFLLAFFMIYSLSSFAQSEDVDDVLKVGLNDVEILAQNYFRPLFDGFGYGFSNGWYNTAKPHKSLGFDITISTHFVKVPDSRKFFTIVDSDYNNVTLDPNQATDQTPTVFGPDQDGPTMNYNFTDPGTGINFAGSFEGWPGLGLKENIGFERIPTPTFQVGIGIIKSTDLIIRYIPNINTSFEDGKNKVGVFGLGIKHDIGQWIPGLKSIPLDVSLLAAFSGFNDTYTFDEINPGKKAKFDVDNWTVQLLVSKKVSVLTVYGGLGITSIKSRFNLLGKYELFDDSSSASLTYTDPISLNYKESTFKGTIGLRLKLGVFTLHSDYTMQEYNIISAGFGFAFR